MHGRVSGFRFWQTTSTLCPSGPITKAPCSWLVVWAQPQARHYSRPPAATPPVEGVDVGARCHHGTRCAEPGAPGLDTAQRRFAVAADRRRTAPSIERDLQRRERLQGRTPCSPPGPDTPKTHVIRTSLAHSVRERSSLPPARSIAAAGLGRPGRPRAACRRQAAPPGAVPPARYPRAGRRPASRIVVRGEAGCPAGMSNHALGAEDVRPRRRQSGSSGVPTRTYPGDRLARSRARSHRGAAGRASRDNACRRCRWGPGRTPVRRRVAGTGELDHRVVRERAAGLALASRADGSARTSARRGPKADRAAGTAINPATWGSEAASSTLLCSVIRHLPTTRRVGCECAGPPRLTPAPKPFRTGGTRGLSAGASIPKPASTGAADEGRKPRAVAPLRPAGALQASRSTRCWILPVAVRGISDSPTKW